MAIEQQMEMFALGGLDDDGMSRDPVSGNEIPPGSMANEVRDDVDAKLSDGEYVVPANVVRFFGVKFFEDLRSQAMQGLSAMEANGRIGGEPVPEAMPMQDQMAGAANELTEQDMAMLQGMMNEGGYVQGYNHGGLHDPVTDKAIPQSVPPSAYPINQFITPGASTISSALNPYLAPSTPPSKITGPGVEGEFKFVTLVNPATGEIQVVQFKGDVPVDADAYNALIKAGFFVQGSPELAAYKQQRNEDNRKDDDAMGGGKPKTVQDLLQSTLNSSFSLGPTGDLISGAINKAFPTTSDQETIDYILETGKFPPSGPGIRDFTKPRMGNGEFPFKKNANGTIQREESKDGPRNVSLDKMQMLVEAAKIRKNNTDEDGKFNLKGYEEEMKKKNLAETKGFGSTKIADPNAWYKGWIKTQGIGADKFGFNDPDNFVFVDPTRAKRLKDSTDVAKGDGTRIQRDAEAKRVADYNAVIRTMNDGNEPTLPAYTPDKVSTTAKPLREGDRYVQAGDGGTASERASFKKDFIEAGGKWASGGRAKGGLIKKPTKKKTKK